MEGNELSEIRTAGVEHLIFISHKRISQGGEREPTTKQWNHTCIVSRVQMISFHGQFSLNQMHTFVPAAKRCCFLPPNPLKPTLPTKYHEIERDPRGKE